MTTTTYTTSAIVTLGTTSRTIKIKGEERSISLANEGFRYVPKPLNETEKDILGLIEASYVHLCHVCNGKEESFAIYEEKVSKLLEVCGLPKTAKIVMPMPRKGKKDDAVKIRLVSKTVYLKSCLHSLYCYALGDIDVSDVDDKGKVVKATPSVAEKLAKLDEARASGAMDEKMYEFCKSLLAA